MPGRHELHDLPVGYVDRVTGHSSELRHAWQRRFPEAPLLDDLGRILDDMPPQRQAIAIGPRALSTVLATASKRPWISILTAKNVIQQLAEEPTSTRPDRSDAGDSTPLMSLYADPAIEQQLTLAMALLNPRIPMGILLADTERPSVEASLKIQASAFDVDVKIVRVPLADGVVATANKMRDISALLLLPQKDLYSAANVRRLIEWSYVRGVPLIGYSASMVEAGVLATAYSSIDHTLQDLSEVLLARPALDRPMSRHVRYWQASINERVARAFNIPINDQVRQFESVAQVGP